MPAAERLDGVDLRIGVTDVEVTNVVTGFGLDTREAAERAIYVLENLADGRTRRAVGKATARLERAHRRCEVVVQLRPARRARLGPRWTGFHSDSEHRLRIAEEWMATQRILVATLTASLDAADMAPVSAWAPVTAGHGRWLLSAGQRDFLADCAGVVVLQDQIALVGPIREHSWLLQHNDLSLCVRRWTTSQPGLLHGLDLVDLEAQTSAADAPFLFPALRSLARQHQVDTEAESDPLAIRALIRASPSSGFRVSRY